MKQLIALTAILIVVGVAGFMYRNALEHPVTSTPAQTACTAEAKLCPDGSAVGRMGPSCEFSPCALPNAEDSAIGIAFVIPSGYVANAGEIGADETVRAVFDKPAKGEIPHSIIIREYSIPEGKTGEEVIIANTVFDPSGLSATSMKEFKPVRINEHTYQTTIIERFEGQVHSAYYLVRAKDVLKFEVSEKDVMDWTSPDLNVKQLPEHRALEAMLSTLQSVQ